VDNDFDPSAPDEADPMTPQVDQAAERSSPDASGPGVVAWYAEGFRDGLGDRLLLFDTAGPGLELLRVNGDLSGADGFEALLRARTEALQGFRHPAFAPIRMVKWLEEAKPTLAIVSDHLAGERLSRVLRLARSRGLRPSPDAVVWMLRRLLPALVALQERQGIAHGLLTADRIVVTPEGGLAIADYVFGGAIERLRFAPFELWDRFGIAVPPGRPGSGLSRQADVEQLARLAIAMLSDRLDVSTPGPVPADELVAQVRVRLTEPQDRRLGDWLARALGLEEPAFYSAREAENALDGMLPSRVGEWATWLLPAPPEQRALASAAGSDGEPGEPDEEGMGATVVMSRAEIEAMNAAATAAAAKAAGDSVAALLPLLQPTVVRQHRVWRYVAIGLAVVAGVEGVLLLARRGDTDPAAPVVTAPALRTTASIEPVAMPPSAFAPIEPASGASGVAGQVVGARSEVAGEAPAAARATPAHGVIGWLSVRSDVPLRVYANGRLLGEGADGTYRLPAGDHEIVLVNADAGVDVKQPVHIVSGETVSIVRIVGDR
jgi:hypothetical protein